MGVKFCVPVIPSTDLEQSLRFWVDGLRFKMSSEMWRDNRLIFCMLQKADMVFILNQRAGNAEKPDDYDAIRLYWTPKNLDKTRERLAKLGFAVSDFQQRDYGHTEFFLTDDDGYSHCFGVPTDPLTQ